MSKVYKIVLSIVVFVVATMLTAVSREIAPHAGWIRIVISVGVFAILLWLWTGKKAPIKEKDQA